ncbi:MAG: AAA family ATPase [Candidatus Pacebacteria bacterium]|nr:AAA family ATPase [Candidatus Paceibacterota bacterium]
MQISLIEFSLENFKTFKNKATFSMVARKNDRHTFESNGENLLKTSFIYGPNASGKTTILEALTIMKNGIMLSSNNPVDAELPYTPFSGSATTQKKPTSFWFTFSIDGKYDGTYLYFFSFVKDHIVEESFVKVLANGNTEELFVRNGQDIVLDKSIDKDLVKKMRKETLFLSVAAQWNDQMSLSILNAIRDGLNIISGVAYQTYQDFTAKKFATDLVYKEQILTYLKHADFCIINGRSEEVERPAINVKNNFGEFSASATKQKSNMLFFEHPVHDDDHKVTGSFEVPFDKESTGTQKFVSVLGPVIDTLQNGKIMIVDEFDNSLHPKLTKFIIDLFESEEMNKNGAQLIVTTHDTSLLSYKDDFIKDQFWFTEKDEFDGSKLFSLGEFDIRNDTEFSKKYLEGRFGALPFIRSVLK